MKNSMPDHNWLLKAYENPDFLASPPARILRVLAEMVEPSTRFRKYHVWDTVVFFGSARTLPGSVARRQLREAKSRLRASSRKTRKLRQAVERAQRDVTMARYYDDAVKLSERLTRWFMEMEKTHRRFMICTGGGPGIMEAANRGAKKAKGKSIGLNISLPFEQDPNRFQTRDLAIEFHYFFIRKFWFFYLAKGLVVFPGGFGTLDEFFELLTIIQTGKSKKHMPVVLYGSEFWNRILDIAEMAEWGTISPEDVNLFETLDGVDETFDYLKAELQKHYFSRKEYRRRL
jgi:uncharacterized protein (TIGR00730 family)